MSSPPTSVKGVLIHQGRVLLLLNERGEWDLPGGRPDPGEDHRTALVREVREEAGLAVEAGALSHEHLETRWLPVAALGESVAGHRLPRAYLAAIRSALA